MAKFKKMWGAHKMGFLSGEIISLNFSDKNKFKENAGIKEKNVFFYQKDEGTQFFYNEDELEKSSEFGFSRFSNQEEVERYLKESRQCLKEAEEVYEEFLNLDFGSRNAAGLFEIFKKQLAVFNKVYSYYHACQPQYFSKIEESIQKKLEEKDKENAHEAFLALTVPEEYDLLGLEELEWLELVEKIRNQQGRRITKQELMQNKELFGFFNGHVKKYLSLGAVETNNPWDFEYYLRLFNENNGHVTEKIEEIKEKKLKLLKRKEEFIKRYDVDENLRFLCEMLSKIGLNRLNLRFAWTKVSHAYMELLREIARMNLHEPLNEENIWDLSLRELEEAIINQKYPKIEDIKKRKRAFLVYVDDGKLNFYVDKEAVSFKEKLVTEDNFDVDNFKGVVACKGKIIGNVFLLTWTEENLSEKMTEMQKGDILVVGQTRPFLMPAIKKAGAIITDEGGIISHAAIISRELGVPCIVGTKIATKVLKSGDLIEVDADQGIITKIK